MSAEEKKMTSFAETLKTDRRQPVLELAEFHDVTVGRAHSIMIKELNEKSY